LVVIGQLFNVANGLFRVQNLMTSELFNMETIANLTKLTIADYG